MGGLHLLVSMNNFMLVFWHPYIHISTGYKTRKIQAAFRDKNKKNVAEGQSLSGALEENGVEVTRAGGFRTGGT